MILFAFRSNNCDKNFDAQILELLVLIDLFIKTMEM